MIWRPQSPSASRKWSSCGGREAERHGVLPLDDRGAAMLFRAAMRPGLPTSRRRFVYYPPISHIVADACPSTARGWTMTVELEHPPVDGDGALIARGSSNSGFVLYVKEGRVKFDYNCFHRISWSRRRAAWLRGDTRSR